MDMFRLAHACPYRPRWTAGYFGLFRDLIRAMCMDSGQELRAAWAAIIAAGGPDKCPRALAAFQRLPQRPEPLTWVSGLSMGRKCDRLDLLREWTLQFRAQCRGLGAGGVQFRRLCVVGATVGHGPPRRRPAGRGGWL